MDTSWQESRAAFADAAAWFVHLTALVGERWDDPGLGEWDVRALVGHATRSFLTVETYLGRPAPAVEVPTAAEYFRIARAAAAGPAVAARGRDAGQALGPDPASEVAAIGSRVVSLLNAATGAEVVTTIVGGMQLRDYLPTRTFELTVHGADLAAALSEPLEVPPTAAIEALRIIDHLAAHDGLAGSLLLAATGRTGLPTGFSVL